MMKRLLGGSHHGRKIDFGGSHATIYMRKKPKKRQWIPQDAGWENEPFTVDEEIYERKTLRKVTKIDHFKVKLEYKTAYVKKGSKIKEETFWKLGLEYKFEYVAGQIGKT